MVDTKDLKSFGQKCPCEFESRFEHIKQQLICITQVSFFHTLLARQLSKASQPVISPSLVYHYLSLAYH